MDGTPSLGRYRLVRKLATGGMAEVFLAEVQGAAGFTKPAVIKRILPHLAEDPSFVEMFLNEARLAARLEHPNVVQIWDLEQAEGTYYLAMEFIDGVTFRTLRQVSRATGTRIPLELAAALVAQACDGLAYAHELADRATGAPMEIVHRDISADNLLLSFQGTVKVLDFGIAKAADQLSKTKTGALKGKLPYMTPEQLRSETLDKRVDIFALGVVLYELCEGRRPFVGTSEAAVMHSVLHVEPEALSRSGETGGALLNEIVRRALAKDRDSRYATCRELQRDLARVVALSGKVVTGQELAALAKGAAERELQEAAMPALTPVAHLASSDAPTAADRRAARTSQNFVLQFEGSAENLLVRLYARYGEHLIPAEADAPEWTLVTAGGEKVRIARAPSAEQSAISFLETAGLRFKPLLGRYHAGQDTAIELWGRAKEIFPSNWEVQIPERNRIELCPGVRSRVQVDWEPPSFRVQASVKAGESAASLADALDAAHRGRRYLKLLDGAYAPLPDAFGVFAEAWRTLGLEGPDARVSPLGAADLDGLVGGADARAVSTEAKEVLGWLVGRAAPPRSVPPARYRGVLRPYQQAGVDWLHALRALGFPALLADDSGLGKKVQALAFAASFPEGERVLVVTPAERRALWESICQEQTPGLLGAGLTLCSTPEEAPTGRSALVVLDAAHTLAAQPESVRAWLSELEGGFKLALTHLPLEGRPDTLRAVFEWLLPGHLGTPEVFEAQFRRPIEEEGDPQARALLRAKILPLMRRRLRREVQRELPPSLK